MIDGPPRSSPLRVRRHPERASYDRRAILQILDEALICHLGFVADGRPWVMPTMYARSGDVLYIHGAPASRMLRQAGAGVDLCLTVTLLDGLVLARSVFNHSMNYRSVVVAGRAEEVSDPGEKMAAFEALVEHVIRGRWTDARRPTQKELRATKVLRLPLARASAKLRSGPPSDAAEDLELAVWAGELPLRTVPRPAVPAPDLRPGTPVPDYVSRYRRGGPPYSGSGSPRS